MSVDLEPAKKIIAKSELWNLDDKLEKAYDIPIGELFWHLHKAGVLDCSQKDSWWSDMTDATEHYDANDVVDLLLRASKHEGMGGLIERLGRRGGLAWNVYCRIYVKETIDQADVLIRGYEQAPEPMKSPWGLELAALGAMPAAQLPDDLLARVGPTAVLEVGGQRWYSLIAKVFEPEVYGPALMKEAAVPGRRIWSLDFLKTCAPYGTPEDWAGLALNIDYRDTVEEMLTWLDEGAPEGTLAAMESMLGGRTDPDPQGEQAKTRRLLNEGLDGDFGKAVAVVWAGKKALAKGEQLGGAWESAMLLAAEKSDSHKFIATVFEAFKVPVREKLVLSKIGQSYGRPWSLAGACPTAPVAEQVVKILSGFKQRDVNRPSDALRPALESLASAQPQPFIDALSGKKLPAREFLAQGLAAGTDEGAIPVLVKLLGDSKEPVREAALEGLVNRKAKEALEKAATSRKAAVKDAGERGLALLDPAPVDADAIDPDASRETVTEAEEKVFSDLWWSMRWKEWTGAEVAEKLAEKLDDDRLLVVAYDGLYKSRGTTTRKLSLWHGVLDRLPADRRAAIYDVEMLSGWPLVITEGYDDSPAKHRASLDAAWARLERYGEHRKPAIEQLLDAAEASGLEAAWSIALDEAWDGLPDRVIAMARGKTGAARMLARAIEVLGDDALPGVRAALADKKADVRLAAAEAIELRASRHLLPLTQKKDRAGKVRDQLARAAFACASVEAPPLAEDPELDARLAAYPGDAPKGAVPGKLPGLKWADGSNVSEGATTWLLCRLGYESPEFEDPALAPVCARLDRDSAAAFWRALRKAVDQRWTVFAGAYLGSDADMQALGDGLDDEARHGSSAQAFYKLETLRRHGSPAALTWVDHWARNAKSQGLQGRAEVALEEAARARGTTPDAIADEICADFGLDAAGERSFSYGTRQIILVLAADGAVAFTKPDGKTVKSLPKALASDDADQVKADKKAINSFKKQLKAALGAAGERLEQAMVTGRRWERDLFERTWGSHPLLTILAREVWWAGFGDAVVPLRLDDGQLVDRDGVPYDWRAPVGVVHPLELDESTRSALPVLNPPFRQVGRSTPALEGEEPKSRDLTRFEDTKVGTGRMRGHLERRRWLRGAPQDGGGVLWYTKYFPRAGLTAQVKLDPGFSIGGYDYGPSEQSMSDVEFASGEYGRDGLPYKVKGLKLGEVDPVVMSEVLADLKSLAMLA